MRPLPIGALARFVDHTHADAVLAVTNTADGRQRVTEIYGNRVVVIPYVMPGFKLARLYAELFPKQAGPQTIGMLLMNHGMFSFAETARESYERMIELVGLSEDYLAKHGATLGKSIAPAAGERSVGDRRELAELRRAVSDAAGVPMILRVNDDDAALAFARRPDVANIATQGPATPDHVIRTKRVPMIGRDVEAYAAAYPHYFDEHGDASLTMLDPSPRVILDQDLGLVTVGRTAKDAGIVEDIYRHTMEIIGAATELGGWQALDARDTHSHQYAPSQRRIRHRHLDAGGPGAARCVLRLERRGLQDEQRAERRGHQPGRGGTGGGIVRPAFRENDRRTNPGRWRQGPRDLIGFTARRTSTPPSARFQASMPPVRRPAAPPVPARASRRR